MALGKLVPTTLVEVVEEQALLEQMRLTQAAALGTAVLVWRTALAALQRTTVVVAVVVARILLGHTERVEMAGVPMALMMQRLPLQQLIQAVAGVAHEMPKEALEVLAL